MTTVSRRRFLQVLGALGLAQAGSGLQGQDVPLLPEAPEYRAPTPPRGLHELQGAYTFLFMPEARFVEAFCARIIPSDELGPGAVEAGVPQFIDQQLQGKFGLAAKWYMQGPWGEGTEQQGYQLPLTPQEVVRAGIAALDAWSEESEDRVFADLPVARQDAVLRALENGELSVPPLPDAVLSRFWNVLHGLVIEGYFADPAYGGNRDKVGWRLVGFPGVAAAYRGAIELYYDRPYRVEPVSIADIQAGRAEMDGTGHAVHREIDTGRVMTEVQHDHDH